MRNLPSEQLPNDGGYHLSQLIDRANTRLKLIGKHGKRATIKVTPKPNKPISIQFSLNGKQTQRGLNLPLNRANLLKAEEICMLITSQLVAGTYGDNWLNALLGKEKPVERKEILTCGIMIEAYKKHYFRQREQNKSPSGNWSNAYKYTEKVLNSYSDKPISLQIIREVIDSTPNNSPTRKKHLNGLANLLVHFENTEFKQVIKKYKQENNPQPKKKHIPSDNEILNVYQYGFERKKYAASKYYDNLFQWQFLYGLLAVYGLRIHEAWNIKNWDSPVTFKSGDYIALTNDTDNIESKDKEDKLSYRQIKKDTFVPAILDPNNEDYLLCIGHKTKTGFRVAIPICPNGHSSNCQWIKDFNLIQPLNLPVIKDALMLNQSGCRKCTATTTRWFHRHKYGFSPHALRHAYNIRGHKLGINQKVLADSLGHGLIMNSSTYLRHESNESKIQGLKREINIHNANRDKIEQLKAENERLKAENERLRTELKMYEILKKDR